MLPRSTWIEALAVAVAALAAMALSWSPIGDQIDLSAYDFLLRRTPPPPQPSKSVILAIDEESLAEAGGLLGLRRPLAQALEIVARHRPAAVAVDLLLAEPRSPQDDDALERALASTPNLALGASLRSGGAAWEDPLERFASQAAAIGHVHAEPDRDNVCRRLTLAKAAGRTRRWALALETLRLAEGGGPIIETPQALLVGSRVIPADHRSARDLLIRFPNPAAPIETLTLNEVLDNPSSAAVVAGRPVFVGVRVVGGLDRYLMTPYSFGSPMAGVTINASVYETLARGDFLKPVAPSLALAAALVTALGLWLCFRAWTGRNALLAAAAVLAAAHALPAAAFAWGFVLPASQTLLVGWACFLTGAAVHYLGLRGVLASAEAQRTRYQQTVRFVTHEMRTPLTAIQGSSELISRFDLPQEKRREIGGLIHRESQRLAKLVDLFLSVERVSSGSLELRREAVDPDALLAECVDRIRPLAERKSIVISHPREGVPTVWGDREFLEYACYNLLSNAVKYSPAETAITVRATRERNRVLVSVEDQGYGMDEADLPHIFQRFYRARSAQQSGEPGSGLGLAIVKEIMAQHGGAVAVDSRLGHGARFTLSLPCAAAAAATAAEIR